MKYQKYIAFAWVLLLFSISDAQQRFFIPAQKIQPYKLLEHYSWDKDHYEISEFTMAIDSFEISSLITLGEYKEYLIAIKNDSSDLYYQSQLPDAKILSKEDYSKYLSDKAFEKYPVVGVSCDNAMNYCKWKTLQEKGRNLQYIYRIPKVSEWLSAYSYLKGNDKNDLSKNYSDMTMNIYYEGGDGGTDTSFVYDWYYVSSQPNDKPRDKRKRVIGDSYLFQHERLDQHLSHFYYSFEGHREVGFRLVKEYLKDNDPKSISSRVIKYWGISVGN